MVHVPGSDNNHFFAGVFDCFGDGDTDTAVNRGVSVGQDDRHKFDIRLAILDERQLQLDGVFL